MQSLLRFAVGVSAIAAIAAAQSGFRPLDTVPWKPSKVSALALAKRADASMSRLRGIEADTITLINYDGTGQAPGKLRIQDGRTFNVSAPWVHYPTKAGESPIPSLAIVSDGKIVEEPPATGRSRKTAPLPAFRFGAGSSVKDWVLGMPRYILGGIRGETPLTSLVQMASRPGSGYKVSVEERIYVVGKYRLPQNRIVIVRNSAEAKRLGPVRIEVAIDGFRKLPVQATVVAKEKGRKPLALSWLAEWNMRPKTFPAGTFTRPSQQRIAAGKRTS